MQLSSGWRQPHRNINIRVLDDTSSQQLELYKVNESLYLAWTIDVLEENSNYVQVLKIWDVLPLPEVSNLSRDIDISYKSSNHQTNYNLPQADPVQFQCNQFSSLGLGNINWNQ